MSGPMRKPIGTPLDESSLEHTYMVVAMNVPDDLPPGRIALVLKRQEDDPFTFGVVDWEPNTSDAHRYLLHLIERHENWRKT